MPSIFCMLYHATCIIQHKRQTQLPTAYIPHSPLSLYLHTSQCCKCSHNLTTFNHFPSTHFMFLTKISSYPKMKDELIPHFFFYTENSTLPPPTAELNTGICTNVRSQVWQQCVRIHTAGNLWGSWVSPRLKCASSDQNPLSPSVFHLNNHTHTKP